MSDIADAIEMVAQVIGICFIAWLVIRNDKNDD